MAYVVMIARAAGYIVLNTDWDIIVGNFAAGVPDIFTTDGDIAIGTGANAAERVNAFDPSNFLKHEHGGLEADISTIVLGGVPVGTGVGTIGIATLGTQAQAEAGTDTSGRLWAAAQLKQAIDALSPAASPAKTIAYSPASLGVEYT